MVENNARDLYSGLIRLHVLHHACEGPIFGLGMLEELARHGYWISPGTLYPMLHRMERLGWLKSKADARKGKRARRDYRLTAEGRAVLRILREQLKELYDEVGGRP